MTPFRWRCETCAQLIVGDTGYVGATYAEINSAHRVEWFVTHDACRSEDFAYQIGVVVLRTPDDLHQWTAHLSEKDWYPRSSWRATVLAQTGHVIPAWVDDQTGPDIELRLKLRRLS